MSQPAARVGKRQVRPNLSRTDFGYTERPRAPIQKPPKKPKREEEEDGTSAERPARMDKDSRSLVRAVPTLRWRRALRALSGGEGVCVCVCGVGGGGARAGAGPSGRQLRLPVVSQGCRLRGCLAPARDSRSARPLHPTPRRPSTSPSSTWRRSNGTRSTTA